MAHFTSTRKTIVKYALIGLAFGLALIFYTDDHDAPRLSDFKFEPSLDNPARYEFSGRLTDARGVASATFECVSQASTKLVIVVSMSGSNRNQTSFGILSRSPNWSGNWRGTSYDLEFSGRADFPSNLEPIDCTWTAKLRDNLGNENLVKELQETKIRID